MKHRAIKYVNLHCFTLNKVAEAEQMHDLKTNYESR